MINIESLSIVDLLELANEHPEGTQITSPVETQIDDDGNEVKSFYILKK